MEYLIYISPIVLGICEVVKRAGISTRYVPIFGVFLGVALSFFLTGGYSAHALVEGLVSSLTALGFYSGVKKTIQG